MANELPDSLYREINKRLNELAEGRRKIELAEQAGHNMDEYRQAYALVEKRLLDHKKIYWPDRP